MWRRIEVLSDTYLDEAAAVFEAAMGWLGSHMHLMHVEGITYGMALPDWLDIIDADERDATIDDVLPFVGSKLQWDYDTGDGWEHDVVVEAISIPERGVEYPRCIGGRRACPPEDSGGPWGYADIVDLLSDPNRPDPEDIRAWVRMVAGDDFDPKRFDREAATAAMRSPRPLWSP